MNDFTGRPIFANDCIAYCVKRSYGMEARLARVIEVLPDRLKVRAIQYGYNGRDGAWSRGWYSYLTTLTSTKTVVVLMHEPEQFAQLGV